MHRTSLEIPTNGVAQVLPTVQTAPALR
jgi:hypothetical protein